MRTRRMVKTLSRGETHVGLHVSCPLLLSGLNQNWDVFKFQYNCQYQIS
jgi:hypothetical protein